MRYRLAFGALLILAFAVVLESIRAVASGAQAQPEVKVAIAVVEGQLSTARPLHVIIENVSPKPQAHFDEWNSWGYFNLSVQWTDERGNTGKVTKAPRGWDRNAPTATQLRPGQALVRDVSFDRREWQGWPQFNGQITLKLTVTYDVKEFTQKGLATADADIWSGKSVTSEEQIITIVKTAASDAVTRP